LPSRDFPPIFGESPRGGYPLWLGMVLKMRNMKKKIEHVIEGKGEAKLARPRTAYNDEFSWLVGSDG
jgi:hypothetical protein